MHPTTQRVLDFFRPIAEIPRPSKAEEQIAQWLEDWAAQRNLSTRRDEVGNLVIASPGSPGCESAPTVVLQGHMDMVCEKAPDAPRDPATQGVSLVFVGEWLTADRTTLGADNGIAIAMALALLDDPNAKHPPIEVLLTVDEETGLTGALGLSPDLLTGRMLLNIDSEDEGVLTVGCAGGRTLYLHLPLEREPVPQGYTSWTLRVSGLTGGHSGVDIHEQRGNANLLLARALSVLVREHRARIVSLEGGSAHNAIPRDATAHLMLPAGVNPTNTVETLARFLVEEHQSTDPELSLSIATAEAHPAHIWTAAFEARILDTLLALPHGVYRYSSDIEGLVQTSNNLARVAVVDDALKITSSQRSSIASELASLCDKVAAIGALAGARVESSPGYPGWAPNMSSPLLERSKRLYAEELGRPPVVEIIHAGLECGVIGDVYPDMDMISFGPTIQNPHSPDERLHLPSVATCYHFMAALLAELGQISE